ncbi:MAG: hypothetical protein WCK76_07665 [Elusimicrobiota bacterium]
MRNPFLIIVFCTLFSLAYAWALISIIERETQKYGRGLVSFADTFLAGIFALGFVYLSDLAVMFLKPGLALYYNVFLLTLLLGFALYKESGHKLREVLRNKKLRAEMRVLGERAAGDPSNAAYFERASEILEKLGELDNAAAAARRAVNLGPTVRNMMRLKHIEEELRGGHSEGYGG